MPTKATKKAGAGKRRTATAKKAAPVKRKSAAPRRRRWTASRLREAPYSLSVVQDILLSVLDKATNPEAKGLVGDALEEMGEAMAYQARLHRRLAKATNRPVSS